VAGVVLQDGSRQVCHIRGDKTKSPNAFSQGAQNVPMTSRPGRAPLSAKARPRIGRIAAAVMAIGSCLLFAQCAWLSPPPGPTAGPSSSTPQQERTITDANLITAADLPSAIGGGKVIEYDHNARSLDQLSICQPQPLATLGATAIKSRSFRARYPSGDRPFPRSPLDAEPDRYGVALQFADPGAAQRAKSIYETWVTNCASSKDQPDGVHALRRSLDWTQLPVADPARAEVAEVVYRDGGSSDRYSFFESVGLTVLEDRMMITVHLFYTDESLYSVNIDDDEAGFAHPQLGLIEAAAKRLSE
jgi:hypothetical protein